MLAIMRRSRKMNKRKTNFLVAFMIIILLMTSGCTNSGKESTSINLRDISENGKQEEIERVEN